MLGHWVSWLYSKWFKNSFESTLIDRWILDAFKAQTAGRNALEAESIMRTPELHNLAEVE